MFYAYFQQSADCFLFELPRWDDEVKDALIFAMGYIEENELKFVWTDKPMYLNCGIEDLEYYIEKLEFDAHYSTGDELYTVTLHLDVLKSLNESQRKY